MAATLYPAIDLRGGKVVRLVQGDYDRQTTYDDDPVRTAVEFAEQGAIWIHVVDLDAAKTGEAHDRDVIAAIAAAVRGRAQVQSGGGVRTMADVESLAGAGVARVVMGSAALANPALVAVAAAVLPVAVGLDHRDGVLAVHGWTESSGVPLLEALGWFPSASAFVITDIGRDGMLEGPDLDGLTAAAARAAAPVVASGGVSTLDDVAACAAIPGVGGVITGRALYEGRFTVAEAVLRLAGGVGG
jgi:phosphoribosylformimino-5-aminoimidazole carboxamide ribotide isomerase